jgi:GNAT superfamily N-acetyltransferase
VKIQHDTFDVLDVYARHLKALTPTDRYTRFGHTITDYSIDQLILKVLYNKPHNHLFTACYNGAIVGFGHVASEGNDWELAVSVEQEYQGKGVAGDLIQFMIDWGKVHGIHSVYMHCINDNKKIQHLARKHGLRLIERSGTELTACVELPDATPADYTKDFMREQQELLVDMARLQKRLLENLNPLTYAKHHNISN